jgi:hypothetical protein
LGIDNLKSQISEMPVAQMMKIGYNGFARQPLTRLAISGIGRFTPISYPLRRRNQAQISSTMWRRAPTYAPMLSTALLVSTSGGRRLPECHA